jgi:lysophospholipase L1-like esterase
MKKVLSLGDSIALQYGPYLEQYLRGLMAYERVAGTAEALKNLDLPNGANLGDSNRVLAYLHARLAKGLLVDADYLLLNCGLHDIRTDFQSGEKQVPLEQYKTNLPKIIEAVKQLGPRLIWVRTTPCDEAVHNVRSTQFHRYAADGVAYNAAADEIMAAAGVKSLDLYTFTVNLGLGREVYCDHVHFPEHVREKQAAFLAGGLLAL